MSLFLCPRILHPLQALDPPSLRGVYSVLRGTSILKQFDRGRGKCIREYGLLVYFHSQRWLLFERWFCAQVAEEEETTDLPEPIHVEVHQIDLPQQLQHAQQQLTTDQQATITLQQDFTQSDVNQVQSSVIQDALVSDAQLQSTLNPQQVSRYRQNTHQNN